MRSLETSREDELNECLTVQPLHLVAHEANFDPIGQLFDLVNDGAFFFLGLWKRIFKPPIQQVVIEAAYPGSY